MDRIDFFVEKATEMNIAEITFLQTDQSERKHLNIEKIIKQSIAASKQSHRLYFPKINGLTKLSDFAKTIIPSATYIAHCDESFARTSLAQLKTQNNITILIGPEGDFSTNEIKTLSELGIQSISLGSQRLRTETAGILVAAWNYSQSFE
jgi:16S rRNA (uracil1498-N3)-methyltransferase